MKSASAWPTGERMHRLANAGCPSGILARSFLARYLPALLSCDDVEAKCRICHSACLPALHGCSHSINLGFDLCRVDLLEYVLSRGVLSEGAARRWSRQLIAAIVHLHACDVVHLDVKLENAFIDLSGQLKLGDLGLAAVLTPGQLTQKMCGSGVYAAPEVILSKEEGAYDGRAADIWSVGVCFFVMVRGRFPFQVKYPTKLYKGFVEASREAKATGTTPMPAPRVLSARSQREPFSLSLLRVLDAALALDPADRPSARQLASAPWLGEADDVEEQQLASLPAEEARAEVGQDDAQTQASQSPPRFEMPVEASDSEPADAATESASTCSDKKTEAPAPDTNVSLANNEGYSTPREKNLSIDVRKLETQEVSQMISTQLEGFGLRGKSAPVSSSASKKICLWDSNATSMVHSPTGTHRERQPERRTYAPYRRRLPKGSTVSGHSTW